MSDQSHVTAIYDVNGQHTSPGRVDRQDDARPYTALCAYCPWRSEAYPLRIEAVEAARLHREETP